MSIERKQIQTAIYACGGMGIKRATEFRDQATQDELNHLSHYFIDTSASDINSSINPDDLFIVPGMDGAGKDRKIAYPQIVPHVPAILQKFPAKDFNIVLQSASGGSGSAAGPAIVSKLLEEDKNVILMIVGSVGSKKEVENTLGTIRTYANFSKKFNKPLLTYYRENNASVTRSEIDKLVLAALFMTTLLFSSENNGLDTSDLNNLVNYHRVTSFDPELSSFDFHTGSIELPETLIPQAAAILFAEKEGSTDVAESSNSFLEYRAEGFLNTRRTQQIADKAPLYGVVYTGDLVERIKELEAHLARFEAAEKARKSKVVSVASVEADNDDGMVF